MASKVITLSHSKFCGPPISLGVADCRFMCYQCRSVIVFLNDCPPIDTRNSKICNSSPESAVQDSRTFVHSGPWLLPKSFLCSDSKMLVVPLLSRYQSQTPQRFGSYISRCISLGQAFVVCMAVEITLRRVPLLPQDTPRLTRCSRYRGVGCFLQLHDPRDWLASRATGSRL